MSVNCEKNQAILRAKFFKSTLTPSKDKNSNKNIYIRLFNTGNTQLLNLKLPNGLSKCTKANKTEFRSNTSNTKSKVLTKSKYEDKLNHRSRNQFNKLESTKSNMQRSSISSLPTLVSIPKQKIDTDHETSNKYTVKKMNGNIQLKSLKEILKEKMRKKKQDIKDLQRYKFIKEMKQIHENFKNKSQVINITDILKKNAVINEGINSKHLKSVLSVEKLARNYFRLGTDILIRHCIKSKDEELKKSMENLLKPNICMKKSEKPNSYFLLTF